MIRPTDAIQMTLRNILVFRSVPKTLKVIPDDVKQIDIEALESLGLIEVHVGADTGKRYWSLRGQVAEIDAKLFH